MKGGRGGEPKTFGDVRRGEVRTCGLAVGHGKTVVLDGVDLLFEPGSVTVVIGPNGSGKSTLLRTIARQLDPLCGSVQLDGGNVALLSGRELARRMASLFTENRSPDLLTCRDVVESGRYPYSGAFGRLSEEDRAAVERAMGLFAVGDLADTDFSRISDGQRQRVLLARAVAQEPYVLILDEPTSYLDARHQIDLLHALRGLAHEQGLCIVMSLHELALAQRVADQVVAVSDGRVAVVGAPEDVFTRETIGDLYGLEAEKDVAGGYNPLFGSIELPVAAGMEDPRAFVVAGAGTGAETFRRLHRDGVPFATGVLHEGDVDCVLARDLGACVVATPAFEPIGDRAYQKAADLLGRIAREGGELIDCNPPVGSTNARNRDLVDLARRLGIRVVRAGR